MILLFSESNDHSTSKVIDWLVYYGKTYLRVNENTPVEILNYSLDRNELILLIENRAINMKTVSGYWYRRGEIKVNKVSLKNIKNELIINSLFTRDQISIRNFIYYYLENNVKNVIGSYFRSEVNKIVQLNKAKKVKLNTPFTILTKSLNSLNCNKKYITKSFNGIMKEIDSNKMIVNYTNVVKSTNDSFFCSFIQEKLNKLFEIRVFYIKGKCYSMAIFSQDNPKTIIDFRRYDHMRPNKFVPFKLPYEISKKVNRLMNSFSLNTGSLDFVYTKEKYFVFLEINPVGQFGMISGPCHYNLEKIIALELLK